MKFVLFRHAHKGILPFEDPDLSPQGHLQAEQISRDVSAGKIPAPTRLLVSPKRRAGQTFLPVAQERGLPLTVQSALDQHLSGETTSEFRDRIRIFINSLTAQFSGADVIYACTHYDWIEEAMSLIPSDRDLNTFEFSHWSPTQYLVFEVGADQWTYLQKGSAK